MRSTLAFTFAALSALAAGCATTPDGGGDDTTGGDDDMPWYNGTSTLAGTEEPSYVDGPRSKARFNNPVNVAFRDGKVYVADFDNGKIRVVTQDGTTTTLVSQKDFMRPFAMTFGGDGKLYVTTDKAPDGTLSDMTGTVWRVDASSGVATVLAERIGRPRGLAWWNGKLAVSDYQHHVIQLVDPGSGNVLPLAGTWNSPGMIDATGTAAKFSAPYGMAVDGQGRLIVADFDNSRVRVVASGGIVTSLAGGSAGFGDGTMTAAKFNRPQGVAVAQNGDIFVSDTDNYRIRRIHGDTVETVAGDGTAGWVDGDDNATAQFFGLEGIAVSADGSMVYVADGNRGEDRPFNRIRQVKIQ